LDPLEYGFAEVLLDIYRHGDQISYWRWRPPPAIAAYDSLQRTKGWSPRSSLVSWAGCSEARAPKSRSW
jgi:hypothetical protein